MAFTTAIVAILALPILSAGPIVSKVGDVTPRDIYSPRHISYVSAILAQAERDKAAADIVPIYTLPDSYVAREQVSRARQVADFIGTVRADTASSLAQKQTALEAVTGVTLSPAQTTTILGFSDNAWTQVESEMLNALDWAMRNEIRQDNVDQMRARIPFVVSMTLPQDQAAIAAYLAQQFVIPNSFYDAKATATARANASQAVEPVTRSFEAGEIVVREGHVVTALDIEALDHLGLLQPQTNWRDLAVATLYGAIIAIPFGLGLWCCQADLWNYPHRLILLAVLIVLFIFMGKVMLPGQSVLPYLFPAAGLATLFAVLIGPAPAVLAATTMGVLAGMLSSVPDVIVYVAVGSLVAALSVRRAEPLSAFFRVGLYVTLVNIAVLVAFRLPTGFADIPGTLTLAVAAVANGSLTAGLAAGGVFLMGNLFGIVTPLQLQALARLNHPLLELLLTQAPGTYHHTRMVATLAEQAAERIGADALLVRVGALYHDAGKTAKPYMFIENQPEGTNIHDTLDAHASAKIIRQHVDDGLALARRYGLPSRIRDFIAEHHGTMRISFMYDKAVRQAGGDASKVDERAFHYCGPKPQSRETALLMLADGCEAATRAAHPSSVEEIHQIISKVIVDRIAWGQLDECPLTLRDLELVGESFTLTLQGVYHSRIPYLGQDALPPARPVGAS